MFVIYRFSVLVSVSGQLGLVRIPGKLHEMSHEVARSVAVQSQL